jgi:hypothetical protein
MITEQEQDAHYDPIAEQTMIADLREANEKLIAAAIRAQELADEAAAAMQRAEESESELRAVAGGRVAPERCRPEAPTDPDVQVSRIRLFETRLRYAGRARLGVSSG